MKTEIEPEDIWNEDKMNKIKDFIDNKLSTLTPEELIERNISIELLVKKYKEEDKIRND